MALSTLSQICGALEDRAYNCRIDGDAVVVRLGNEIAPFPVILTINSKNELVVVCQLAELSDKLSDIEEKKAIEFAFAALAINTKISPFAVGMIVDDSDLDDFPIILQNNVPLGDLCEEELESTMQSLSAAIVSSQGLLVDFLQPVATN